MAGKDTNTTVNVDRSCETTSIGIPWLQYAHYRSGFKKRWPTIWHLPIVTNPFAMLANYIKQPEAVLDVGATDRVWEPAIRNLWPGACYRSLDLDRTNRHDYYSFDAVDMRFDLVLCFEVLEHLPPRELLEMIQRCISACKPGHFLAFSVPNLLADSYWMDFTHQTALSFWDLPTLMNYCGLEIVEAARWCTGSARKQFIHRHLFGLLHRALNKDYCQSILVLGKKTCVEQAHSNAKS